MVEYVQVNKLIGVLTMTKELNKKSFVRMIEDLDDIKISTDCIDTDALGNLIYCNMKHFYLYEEDNGKTSLSKEITDFMKARISIENSTCHYFINEMQYNYFIAYRSGNDKVAITRYSSFSGRKLSTYHRAIKTTSKGHCFDYEGKRYYINRKGA